MGINQGIRVLDLHLRGNPIDPCHETISRVWSYANSPMPLLDSPGVGQTGWQKAILCLQTSYDLEEAANEVDLRNIKELEAA